MKLYFKQFYITGKSELQFVDTGSGSGIFPVSGSTTLVLSISFFKFYLYVFVRFYRVLSVICTEFHYNLEDHHLFENI